MGIAEGLGFIFKAAVSLVIVLVLTLAVAIVASLVGWSKVVELWPFGFTFICGSLVGGLIHSWFSK
jgi:hypothetical protein